MNTMRNSFIVLLLGAALAGCSAKASTTDSFVLHNTSVAVAGTTRSAISGHNLAFLASEGTTGPGGTDFNGDGDKTDSIAVAVEMGTHTERVLDVAAKDVAWIGNELYLVVDEALDSHDWNVDADMLDVVLLHWSASDNALTWVDDLDSSNLPQFVAIGTNLFYTAATTPSGGTQSNLKVISSSAPLTATTILTHDVAAELKVEILAVDEGLVFLGLDETDTDNNRDLNADTDTLDTHVLALLDGTTATGVIRNTALALGSGSGPFRAKKIAAHDWDVGFLVSESEQGNANLNGLPAVFDSAWWATQCVGFEDTDTSDNVLHFILFSAWDANPVTAPPRNTGLAGRDKIAIASGFIACLCAESDEGTCDLNGDGDTSDEVVRWTQLVSGNAAILPLNTAANLHAIFDCPGGTHGLAELDEHFIEQVSESADNRDIDGDSLKTKNLLGWLTPSNTAHAWDFTPNTAATWAGASWMREQHDRTRLDVAFQESVNGININVHNPPVAGEDLDTNDSLPTFADFSNSTTLTYPGVAVAVRASNAGIVIGRDVVFYRVDEVADSRDWNGDGDETDMILFRTSLTQGTSAMMGVLNDLTRLSVDLDEIGTPSGAAFLVDESMAGIAGTDYNGDGDTNDYVVRYLVY
jgi:hypothetical protein